MWKWRATFFCLRALKGPGPTQPPCDAVRPREWAVRGRQRSASLWPHYWNGGLKDLKFPQKSHAGGRKGTSDNLSPKKRFYKVLTTYGTNWSHSSNGRTLPWSGSAAGLSMPPAWLPSVSSLRANMGVHASCLPPRVSSLRASRGFIPPVQLPAWVVWGQAWGFMPPAHSCISSLRANMGVHALFVFLPNRPLWVNLLSILFIITCLFLIGVLRIGSKTWRTLANTLNLGSA